MQTPEQIAEGLSEAQKREWAQQERDWPTQLQGAKQGNPWATLCLHCHSRHEPPNWFLCPNTNLNGERAARAMPKELGFKPIRSAVREILITKEARRG